MHRRTLPEHVAIIMDGNGRWAKKRGLPRQLGHQAGVKAVRRTIKAAYEIGIKYLSIYVFSTENWKRPPEEVRFLMGILDQLIGVEVRKLHKHGVKVKFIGDVEGLNDKLQEKVQWAETFTRNNSRLQLNLLVNYGGRQDIVQAAKRVFNQDQELTVDTLQRQLYTGDIPDPDLIIRTGGEQRISNFLLWQSAYSEFWYTKSCWPDFNKTLFNKAIDEYMQRDRRYGGLDA